MFGVPAVVAINSFPTDTPAEVEAIREVALEAGADDAVVATHFTDGGRGAADLANAVWAAASRGSQFQLLYPDDAPLGEKILTIATKVYGAAGIELLPAAKKALKLYEDLGFGRLPVCMAKTQYSLSHDADAEGPAVGVHRHRSATSGCRPGRGSSRRSSARCGRCPGCRRDPAARRSTSTRTGTSSGCSDRARGSAGADRASCSSR